MTQPPLPIQPTVIRARPADQALAVPATPVPVSALPGFDPGRWASVLTPQERRYLMATPLQEPAEAGFIAQRAGDNCGHGTPFSGFARRRPALFQVMWKHPCRNKRVYRLTPAGFEVREAAIAIETQLAGTENTGSVA